MIQIFVLPEKQERVWFLSCLGLSQKEISNILKISRQATSLYLRESLSKIRRFFLAQAATLDLDILGFEEKCGLLLGRCRQFEINILLVYIPRIGIRSLIYRKKQLPTCGEGTSCKLIIDYIEKNFAKKSKVKELEKKVEKVIDYLESRLLGYQTL